MKISDAQNYPVENMSLVYSSKTNDVYQAVFQTEKFGTFTRVDGRWRALSPEDTSLENLSIIDILPEDYKEVTELFDAAQKVNRYLTYDEVREFEVGYSFDESAEAFYEEHMEGGALSQGFHAFEGFDFVELEIDRSSNIVTTESPLIYTFKSNPALKYFKINGSKCVSNSELPGAKLLLSITYKLVSPNDVAEVYNRRQIYQLGEDIFLYLETGFAEFYGHEINKDKAKIQNLGGLIICEPIDKILESFTLWLVEVDPIGFELLRRMNRDGFTNKLSITEDLMWMHDSDDFMDKWFVKMTDYADSIELDIEIDMEERGFALALKNEVSSADSHTRSDFFESSLAEDWVHPRERNSNNDDEDDDEEIPDLTDEDIEQLRKEARARQKESEQLTFADVPPALQELIHDLIQRVENKIGFEDAEECSFQLRGFIEGEYKYTQSELSSQMAKHLRMLT